MNEMKVRVTSTWCVANAHAIYEEIVQKYRIQIIEKDMVLVN